MLGVRPAQAQQVVATVSLTPTDVVRHFDLADGLPQSSVTAILPASSGFLWLGTYGGLARFDGRHFVTVRAVGDAGLGSDRILSLAEGPSGELWVGTEDGGLSVYAAGQFQRVAMCSGTCRVGGLVMQPHRVLAATDDGLYAIDLVSHRATQLDPTRELLHIVATSRGRVFVAGRRGMWEVIGDRLTPTGPPTFRDAPVANLVLFDDAPWIEVLSDQYRLVGTEWQPYSAARPYHGITFVYRDLHGTAWASDIQGVMSREEQGELIAQPTSMIVGTVTTAVLDDQGNQWIGTAANGLFLVRRAKVGHLVDPAAGFQFPGYAVASDGPAGVYFGINCDGIRHVSPDGTVRRWDMTAIGAGCPWSMLRDTDGGLWIGDTSGQLGWLRDHDAQIALRYKWAGHGTVRSIAREGAALWVSVDQDTYRFASADTTQAPLRIEALHGMRVTRSVHARAGGLWFLTDHGALRVVDDRVVERWDLEHGLASRFVRALFEDTDGSLWIGTYGGGLDLVQDGHVTSLNRRNAALEDIASCFVTTATGDLWMSGNRGLRVLTRAARASAVAGDAFHVTTIGLTEGLATLEANGGADPACVADVSGRLWFSMIVGFAMVPVSDAAAPSVTLRPPVLESLQVARHDPIELVGRTTPITLAVEARNVEIRFAAPALGAPDDLQLRTRLGSDDQWTDLGDQTSVLFPQVPWGEHTFEVEARLEDGAWSAPARLALVQRRQWYRHPAALALLALAVVVLTLGLQAAWKYLLARRIEHHVRPIRSRVQQLAGDNVRLGLKEKRDAVTALWNAQGLEEAIATRWGQRVQTPLAVVVLGFDGDAGEPELRAITRQLESLVKNPHELACTSATTFAVLLLGLDYQSALDYAATVRAGITLADARLVSAGLSISRPGDHEAGALLERAQAALADARRDAPGTVIGRKASRRAAS